MENIGAALRGMYRDTIYDAENRLVYDSGWDSNRIVVNCRVLLASFMKGVAGTAGISGMMVGSGKPEWDNKPEDPTDALTALVTPYPDKPAFDPAKDISFLDDKNNKTDQPTQRLEITIVLPQNFPEKDKTSALREFGLFGNGYKNMINCVRHPVIQKTSTETLIRTVWLYF